jgi:hypothetical protein
MKRQDTARPTWTPLGRFDVPASVTGQATLGVTERSGHIVEHIRGDSGALAIFETILTEVETHMMGEGSRYWPFPKPAGVWVFNKKKHLWIEVLEMLNDLPGLSHQGVREDEVPCPARVCLTICLTWAGCKERLKRRFAQVVPL